MINFTHRAARAAGAAATLLGVVVLASPVMAGNSEDHRGGAFAAGDGGSRGSSAMPPVEARIKELHKRLHITAAQKPQWDNLAQVMRDNAQAMSDLKKQRAADAQVDERRRTSSSRTSQLSRRMKME